MEYFIDDEITEEDAADRMFYRRYRRMDAGTKMKIRQVVDIWSEDS